MYGYQNFELITVEKILERVTEREIFRIVIPKNIVLDKGDTYKSPFREDNIGSCYFEMYNNKLMFTDFGSTLQRKTFNCFQIIEACFNVDFVDALEIINSKLEIGLGSSYTSDIKKVRYKVNVEENVKKVFKKRTIAISPRPFNHKDKVFWSKYNITRENLLKDGVIPIDIYKSTDKKGRPFTVNTFQISYACTEFPDNKMKIYTPHAHKNAKWFTNCNQDDIGSIKHLVKKGKTLIITKSYKDCRVLRNQGLNSVWFQNEIMIPNRKKLEELCNRFEEIIVWYDNDATGIANSKILTTHLNTISINIARSVFLPPKLLESGIKDPSDYLNIKGQKDLEIFLGNKILS